MGLLVIICLVVGTIVTRKMSEERKKKMQELILKLKIMITNGIHQTINNGSIPIQVTAMFQIQKAESLASMMGPLSILGFMIAYPILIYTYLLKNQKQLEFKDSTASIFHQSAFGNLRFYR